MTFTYMFYRKTSRCLSLSQAYDSHVYSGYNVFRLAIYNSQVSF